MEATANYYFVFTSVSVFTFASLGLCRLKSVLKQNTEPSRLASINSHDGGSAVNLGVDQKYQPLLPHVEGKNAPILGSSGEFVGDRSGVEREQATTVPGFNSHYLVFSLLMHGLLVFSWFLNTCTLYFLSKGDLGLDHQLLCISNCVLWSICSVWIFFMFFRSNLNSAPTFGFLGSWWAVQSALYPILLLTQNIKVWDDTQSISICAKVANLMRIFLPACLFLVTTPIFVEGLFVMKPINRDGTTPQDTSKTSASRLWNLTRKHRQWLIFGCIVLLVRLPFSLAIPHFISQVIGGLVAVPRNMSVVKESIIAIFVAGSIDSFLDFLVRIFVWSCAAKDNT